MTDTPTAVAGRNIRAEMSRRGLSQTAVATRLGISQAAMSARIRGVTPFDLNEVVQLADLFGMTVDGLLVDHAATADAAAS